MMRKSPLQAIFVVVMSLLALIGLVLGVYRMIFMPSTFDWSGLIITIVLLGVILYALRSSTGLQANRKQPKVKPSARTMAKVKAQQGNYKNVPKSSPFAKTSTPGRSTSTSGNKPKKNYPFQVIQGNKGKDDEEMPKYH